MRRQHVQRIVARAGVDLEPLAAVLLLRIERAPHLDVESIGRVHGVPAERLNAALARLRARGLIEDAGAGGPESSRRRLTPAGCEVLERLVAARRAHLEELGSEWPPEHRREVATLLEGLARELVPDAPSGS